MGEVKTITEQHHDLRDSVAELEGMLEKGEEIAPDTLATRLDQFMDELQHHFAFEEAGDLFSSIARQRSSFDREVTRLLRQHGDILGMFQTAHDRAAGGESIEQVAPVLRKAMTMLRGHEQAEMDLVQEAALTDIGGGD